MTVLPSEWLKSKQVVVLVVLPFFSFFFSLFCFILDHILNLIQANSGIWYVLILSFFSWAKKLKDGVIYFLGDIIFFFFIGAF